MKKNIFLGALPISEGSATNVADANIQSGGSVFSPAPGYPIQRLDVVADEPQPTPPQNVNEGGELNVKKEVADGAVVNADTPKNNEDNKFAISAPVIIGAAALIYFFFLRKKK